MAGQGFSPANLSASERMRTRFLFAAIDHIPDPLRAFAVRRTAEAVGIALVLGTGIFGMALATWSVQDPSFNHATRGSIHNLFGSPGAIAADLIMQMLGLSAVAFLAPIAFWGWRLVTARRLERLKLRLTFWILGGLAAAGFASALPVTTRWPLPTGLGGVIGDAMLAFPHRLFAGTGFVVVTLFFALFAILSLSASVKLGYPDHPNAEDDEDEDFMSTPRRRARADDEDAGGEPGLGLISLGALIHAGLSLKAAIKRHLPARKPAPARGPAPWQGAGRDAGFSEAFDEAPWPPEERVEPRFDNAPFDASAYAPPAKRPLKQATDIEADDDEAPGPSRVRAGAPPLKSGQRIAKEAQPSLLDRLSSNYQLPPLLILSEAKKQATGKLSEDALEQNARLLEGVLEDFGVKGDIINVRPGPVVTLYELEPAPGIKSSRVIGLADDIARSMSAISARVAVVQGRNAIGIELPNQRRETVFLRELLASEDFEKSKFSLAIALGKTIGGEPIIVDLAKMPHLLVAGTTGSGKSVAINTMILSLLYRLKPSECRLIMVDPKMLELSVYDGIPHLLTPVVTDPKKAVVALKWAVREMEDRYKSMSKLGVRNIDGFNARVSQALAKGETITRTVQTGYDRETGEAIYEQEVMNLAPLPYIVVLVDEMADLMMVAGKDIEGAIQRLAQMARAAGIHLIMATQRPSVDVITGTIKANFPTRISFQVTSKIDSRTILGEQGAEQLLGQGDMLYMAGGGRISRVHGPFVSDSEVEKVVAHLKSQGQPEYLDTITAEFESGAGASDDSERPAPGSMDAEESGDLYDRAVAIVLRDRKCSTSYIQRRLSVGYNKAASLVERMEEEGVVGAPNHSGKRTILVGGGIDRGAFDLAAGEG
jgi:S-DNA-T family DNA segregation ATPase FtsK/SpoIIIE